MNKLFTFMRESGPARFFIPVGIILIVFGVITLVINIKNQNYIKIEATIIDVKEEEDIITDGDGNHTSIIYNVTLKYIVNDKEYNQTLDNVSKHKIGDKMDIYYNPTNPNQITQTKSLVLPIVIAIVGIASLIGGIISAVNSLEKGKIIKN